MRLSLLMAIIALGLPISSHASASSDQPTTQAETMPLSWLPPSSLSKGDQAVAHAISQHLKSAYDGTNFSVSFWTPNEAALLQTPYGEFLFLRYLSSGSCGDFTFYIYGPPGKSGHRPLMFDDLCVEDIRLHVTTLPVPDLVIPSETTDGILNWRGDHWDDPTKLIIKNFEAMHAG